MQVVLLERIPSLGPIGTIVDVKPGYARNFLLPKKKALRATKENLAYFEQQKLQIEADNIKRKAEAEQVSERMKGIVAVLIRQASDMGHLYGSVRPKDISDALEGQGYKVKPSQINLTAPIKVLGIHSVSLLLHPEVALTIEVNVALSKEEAEIQMKKHRNEEVAEPTA